MTLSFSTQWPAKMGDLAGQPNYFIEKIWTGFPCALEPYKYFDYYASRDEYFERFGKYWDGAWTDTTETNFLPKLHTLRSGTRWRQGMKIHPVINNRTNKRFQFAPIFECKSVQIVERQNGIWLVDGEVLFDPWFEKHNPTEHLAQVKLITKLALNDGFPSVEAFFRWFDTDGTYQLIHWTDLKY